MKVYHLVLIVFGFFFVPFNAIAGDLSVVHLDPEWNGEKVPQKGICLRRGGGGYSPNIKVSNIPRNTASLLFMFTDEGYGREGGHGGFEIKKIDHPDLLVPSFKKDLPEGFLGVKAHHCGRCRDYDGSEYYNGPCSGGKNHTYSVIVYAKNKKGAVLGEGDLKLGVY